MPKNLVSQASRHTKIAIFWRFYASEGEFRYILRQTGRICRLAVCRAETDRRVSVGSSIFSQFGTMVHPVLIAAPHVIGLESGIRMKRSRSMLSSGRTCGSERCAFRNMAESRFSRTIFRTARRTACRRLRPCVPMPSDRPVKRRACATTAFHGLRIRKANILRLPARRLRVSAPQSRPLCLP